MRIMLVVTGLNIGGAERQVVDLAKQFAKLYPVMILTLTKPTAFINELNGAGVDVVSLEMKIGQPSFLALIRGRQIVKSFRPTVVHSHMFHANIYARILRMMAPMPLLISTIHSTYERSRRSKSTAEITWRELAYTLTDRLSNMTTQISKVGLERYLRIGAIKADKALRMPNGVDFSKFTLPKNEEEKMRCYSPEGGAPFRWLAVGRLEKAKNYQLMIHTARILLNEGLKFHLDIVGDGTQRELLQTMVKELDLTSVVTLLGTRNDIPHLMHRAQGYIMSSDWEGLPLVLIEAAASGLVIVATDVGANSEVVKHNETGFLVESKNIQQLRTAMCSVMKLSNSARESMGQRARELVISQFNIQKVSDSWLDVYSKFFNKAIATENSENQVTGHECK